MRASPETREEEEEPTLMVLTGEDRAVFLAALLSPPEPAERLVAALKRHLEVCR